MLDTRHQTSDLRHQTPDTKRHTSAHSRSCLRLADDATVTTGSSHPRESHRTPIRSGGDTPLIQEPCLSLPSLPLVWTLPPRVRHGVEGALFNMSRVPTGREHDFWCSPPASQKTDADEDALSVRRSVGLTGSTNSLRCRCMSMSNHACRRPMSRCSWSRCSPANPAANSG
jgi:hypothetical protein